MKRPRVLTMILAGGKGSRMDMLTEVRAKPTLPFAGVFHLIDFPLSNCVHSGLSDVWVIEQFLPHSLNTYLANGRPWDLDRTYGGLLLLQPHQGDEGDGFPQGNADALYRNWQVIRDFDPDLVLVLSADHVYKLDYNLVLDHHHQHEADVTMVITQVPLESASRYGNVEVDDDDKVTGFAYKPDEPQSEWVTAEVFVYDAPKLLNTLDELVEQKRRADGEDATLEDFGHELIPHLVDQGRAVAYRFDEYWRDVGTVESYWEGHMDLLKPEDPLDLDEDDWQILSSGVGRMPVHVHATATIDNSLISPGCVIRGDVSNSVLGEGVVVEAGASVRYAVILDNAFVKAGATVEYTILDQRVTIEPNATVGAAPRQDDEQNGELKITLVGQDAVVSNGETIEAGGHVKPRFDITPVRKTAQISNINNIDHNPLWQLSSHSGSTLLDTPQGEPKRCTLL